MILNRLAFFNGLGAAFHVHFFEQVERMGFYRVERNKQTAGNFLLLLNPSAISCNNFQFAAADSEFGHFGLVVYKGLVLDV